MFPVNKSPPCRHGAFCPISPAPVWPPDRPPTTSTPPSPPPAAERPATTASPVLVGGSPANNRRLVAERGAPTSHGATWALGRHRRPIESVCPGGPTRNGQIPKTAMLGWSAASRRMSCGSCVTAMPPPNLMAVATTRASTANSLPASASARRCPAMRAIRTPVVTTWANPRARTPSTASSVPWPRSALAGRLVVLPRQISGETSDTVGK